NLEMKLKTETDTGFTSKKIKVFEMFNISSGYNIFADSINFNPIGISANTNILNFFNIRLNYTLNPYAINNQGTRLINQSEFSKTGNIGRTEAFSMNVGFK